MKEIFQRDFFNYLNKKKIDDFIGVPDSTMKYFITTGNAGNIEINLGENKFSKLGKKGEVLNSYNFINYLEKIKSN